MKTGFIKGPFFFTIRLWCKSNLILHLIMEVLKNIFIDCGLDVRLSEQVHGGDINQTYCLFASSGKYFLKVNDRNKYPLMFEKEAHGLDLLRKHCRLHIPQVIRAGESDDQQYLLLEWLEKAGPANDMWEKFGQRLAAMHQQPQQYFGLNEDNYIGSLQQINTPHTEWHSFYIECRIMPLVRTLFDAGIFSPQDVNMAVSFGEELTNLFPVESPSLVHGDLWAGNYLIHSSGYPAIYDPAVYFGHREMDIGMTSLFGGFDHHFYEAYSETYPLGKNWEKRLPLTQLYPLLVHAVLFGGHYVSSARDILKRFS